MDSKKLSNKDESGDRFAEELFSDNRYKDLSINFDRLSFNYKENSWIVIEHLLTNKISSIKLLLLTEASPLELSH